MKVWIDLTNSPHVNFFAGLIRDLQRNNQILLTCRPLANTRELLELYNLPYYVVGKHYGKNSFKKALGFVFRTIQLFLFLKNKEIDVAISHSAFSSPVVARLLGIRVIYLNDNEHAAGNRVSFLFSDQIMVPEFIDLQKVRRQWAKSEKIIQYPGVKEGIYLWNYEPINCGGFKVDKKEKNKVIFVRPEPWTAQYYRGDLNFIDNLLMGIKDNFQIVLLPRDEVQRTYYLQEKFIGISVLEKSVGLHDIIENCDLFIGAGGTMTRETAVLGIPTISIYQDCLLDVDNFLITKGFMIHKKNLVPEFVMNFLNKTERRAPDSQLLQKGEMAYKLIKKTLLDNTTQKRNKDYA